MRRLIPAIFVFLFGPPLGWAQFGSTGTRNTRPGWTDDGTNLKATPGRNVKADKLEVSGATKVGSSLSASAPANVTHPTYNADPTGALDSAAAIAAAYAALPATGGCLFVPPGTYKLSSTVTLNNTSAKRPCIDGYGAVFAPDANVTAITIANGDSTFAPVTIRGLTIDGGSRTGTGGVLVNASYGTKLYDVQLLNLKGTALEIRGTNPSSAFAESTDLNNVYVSNAATAIAFTYPSYTSGSYVSLGYSHWRQVHIDNVPENGIGVDVQYGASLQSVKWDELIVHVAQSTTTASAVRLSGQILGASTIHGVIECLATAPSAVYGLNVASTASLNQTIFDVSFVGSPGFTSNVYNSSNVAISVGRPWPIYGPAPFTFMTDSGQTAPAGRFGIGVSADHFQLLARNGGNNGWDVPLDCTRPANGNTVCTLGGGGRVGFAAVTGTSSAPAISGCSATIDSTSNNVAGEFTSGSTGSCTVTLTFAGGISAPHGWACAVSNKSSGNLVRVIGSTTTTVQFNGTTTSGDVIAYSGCSGH